PKGQPMPLTNRVTRIRFFPERVVRRAADMVLSRTALRMPEYLGTELSVEGDGTGSALAGDPPPLLLARGEGRLSLPGAALLSDSSGVEQQYGAELETLPGQPHFSVGIYLAQPERLYAQARRRARVFGTLIFAAAGLAVFGMARTFQALARQQRLNEMKSNF